MRYLLLLLCLLGLPVRPALAQARPDADSMGNAGFVPAASLGLFAAERTRLDQRGLTVLGGWAVGNLLVGSIATGQAEGPARYFHQMNIGWGAVNLALASLGYRAARRAGRPPLADRAGNVRAQLRTENLYLFNAGLDVAYLATGLYLLEKSRNPTAAGLPDRWRGYGQSLLLQGGFLLVFDGVQYAAHHRHGRNGLYPLLSRIRVGPGAVAVVLPLGETRRLRKNSRNRGFTTECTWPAGSTSRDGTPPGQQGRPLLPKRGEPNVNSANKSESNEKIFIPHS